MIHLLLLTGAAGASSSASIEEKPFGGVAAGASTAIGVGAGSTAEIDTPGRALAAGKCCKRAAKHKRKKLQLKVKWETCKKAAEAPAEVSEAAAGGGQCTQAELDAATKGLFTQDQLDAARQAGIDSVKQDFTAADIAAAKQDGIDSVTPEDGVTQADVNAALQTAETEKQTALQAAATEKAAALQAAATEKAAALAAKDQEIAASYTSNDDVEANYVPKADVEANYVPKADVEEANYVGAAGMLTREQCEWCVMEDTPSCSWCITCPRP